jgi:threonine dehydrogenase-like Zn-dependent dehydrogenase
MKKGKILIAAAVLAAAGAATFAAVGPAATELNLAQVSNNTTTTNKPTDKEVRFQLAPSSDVIKKCLPHAKVNFKVELRTEETGRDVVRVDASGLPPKTSFTAFFLEVPGAPFGAAEYFGDVDTDQYGRAQVEFKLIAEEAFASTIVDGKRVRVDLNHVGMWFADPAADDFCLGKGKGGLTPFDGDNEAGVQAFNSANSLPKAPLP